MILLCRNLSTGQMANGRLGWELVPACLLMVGSSFPLFCSFCHTAHPFSLLTVSGMVSVQELCVSRLYLDRHPMDMNMASAVDS